MPAGVWALGFVSLFMDVSSEMVHALLPVFLVSVLGASVATVGLLEGTAEAIAAFTKVFSGALSDRLRRRKLLTVLGYGIAAATKPLFALAPTVGWVFAARAVDRVGKGIRGAPRDALIADLVPAPSRGAAFGLRQSLDTVGAFAGPLLAIALMTALGGDFRAVFWLAVIPAAVSVLVLVLFVREPEPPAAPQAGAARFSLRALPAGLGAPFWWLVFVASLFTLARFSEAFLILRAQQLGLADTFAPLVLVIMNVVYAASAYPSGRLADRMSHRKLLAAGLAAQAVHFLYQAGWVNVLGTPLWDTSSVLSQNSLVGKMMQTLVGYTDQPTALQLIAYVGTLVVMVALMRMVRATPQRVGDPAPAE